MPVDKFGQAFIKPSKVGGFFYQQEDNPQNSNFVDWPDEMSFPGNGIVRMEPDGPTDFGVGKNVSGFSDSIGGCNMDFSATQSRGYAYKADDARDVEYKAIIRFEDIDPDEGFSISFDTGHHTDDGCCQGFAYMVNLRPGSDPCEFRFRKEMWHVHYISKSFFTDNRVDFQLNGHGFIGFCGIRYNKPGAIDTTVILEMWFNNDPIGHPVDGWFKLATLEDAPGSGFGDGGDDCNGDNDQVGTWSNVQSRMKTNSSSGFCEFKAITLREIDVTKSFDDTPPPPPDPDHNCPSGQVWNGTACVPIDGGGGTPPGGGGTGTPSQITPVISYIIIPSVAGGYPDIHPPLTGVQALMLPIAEDLAETMTDPNPDHIDGPGGWYGTSLGADSIGEIGDTPCDHDWTDEASLPLVHEFADDLAVEPYWSNKDNACTLGLSGNPGGGEPPPSGLVEAYIPVTTFGDVEFFADLFGQANDDHIALVFTEEVMEAQTDTEFDGWQGPGVGSADDGEIGEYCNLFDNGTGTVQTDIEVYPDGIPAEGYWSNRHSDCVWPGLITTPLHAGTKLKYLGGRVQKNPVINLIFWGDAWNTQSQPSRNAILTRIRDKLLNPASSSNAYWSELNQYSGCGSPTFGEYITYTDNEPPATLDTDADEHKEIDMVWDAIATKFTTNFNTLDNQQYVVFLPNGSFLGDPDSDEGFGNASHNTYLFQFVFESTNATLDASPLTDSTIDSDGIAWLEATGEILSWENTRDDSDDFRWSRNTENAGLGYEVTWFVNCQNVDGTGHTAMKLGGGNHSGDCGGNSKQGFDTCCCWYDFGIRQNGDIQTQIEHPHNLNFDVDCDDCTMSDIGMTMNDGWIGLKMILYPEIAGGDVNNGGIRTKMYISTDAIGSNGLPTNDWELVFNTLDTGQWLDDYDWPMYQELEMRLSGVEDFNDVELYKDKVFARRWIRGSTGGGPPQQCPPGQVWDGLSCVSTGTGRIQYHGGRIMKTPIVNLIFWGADWDSRVADPIRSAVVSYTRDKLMGTDKAYFNNLFQYGGIGVPIFGQAVTNLTWPIPTATRVSEEDARLVINDSIERALLPQNADFNNTIYIVLLPVGIIGYHPQNNAEFAATHGSYKPTLTVTTGGGVDEPTSFEIIQFAFTLKSDINVNSGITSCAGTTPAPPPPTDPPVDPPPPVGGTSFFYKVISTSNEKEISNESSSDDRTQITEKVNSSSSAMNGKKLKQADVLLRKESGTNDTTPLIYFKIWDSGNTAVYTSPTTFTPDSLTTSFVGKTFDCSTNTRSFVVGDRCGIEWTGTDPDEFILTAYATSDSGNTGSSGSYEVYKEGSSYDNQTGRRMSMTLWE